MDLTLDEKNMATVMLMQALAGAISNNFRMVALSMEQSIWRIQFVLEKESAEDFEEIEDIVDEFGGLLLDLGRANIELEFEVIVTADFIEIPAPPTRVVFRRKD